MNKAVAIAKLMLLQHIKDKAFWMQLIGIPILLTLIMGAAFGASGDAPKKVKLAVTDNDGTGISKMFVAQLKKDPAFSVDIQKDKVARENVKKRLVSGAIIIPDGYGGDLAGAREVSIEVLNAAGDSNQALLSQVATGLTNRYSADAFAAQKTAEMVVFQGRPSVEAEKAVWEEAFEAADKKWDPAPVTVDAKTLSKSAIRGEKTLAMGFNQSSMGFTITFVMFMLVGGAATILEERMNGTLSRLMTSPTGKTSYLSGKMLGLFTTAIVQASILVGAGKYVFNVDWGRDPLALIVLMTAFIFSMASMGILVAALARTSAQANSVTPILLISMAMIGGCYWPVEITPPFMQAAAKFIPAGWMIKGLTDLITRGYGWDAIVLPTVILLGFGIGFLTLGVWFLKYE